MTSFDTFCSHHVGGRAGSVVFPDLPKFKKEIFHVIYDADEDCINQIEARWKGNSFKVLPYCLADHKGQAILNINFDPYSSSLLKTSTSINGLYTENGKTDYVFKHILDTIKKVSVVTKTIDDLVKQGEVSAPNFLSIDTQGTELAILQGAENALKTTIVALSIEVNFASLYEGVPLFGELDSYLRSKGFILAGLDQFYMGYWQTPLQTRGKQIPFQGEALYLLDPSSIPNQDITKLENLAFAAIAFGYTDIAFSALTGRQSTGSQNRNKPSTILSFLEAFLTELNEHSEYPEEFHNLVSAEQSAARFNHQNSPRIRELIYTNPGAFIDELSKFLKSKLKGFSLAFPWSIKTNPRPSKFESFLKNYGFNLAALEVQNRRLEFERQHKFNWLP
jgi:FkbM family methyltransferase